MRRLLLGILAAVLCGAVFFHRPLLEASAGFLIEDDTPAAADAIVVLAGSAVPDRILEAAMLYRAGFAPRILLSREPESERYQPVLRKLGITLPSQDELHRSVAHQLGVPPDAIIAVAGSPGSTFSEAREILPYILAHRYRTILLVTSKLHTSRAARIYRRLAGDRVRIISRPSRYDQARIAGWWRDRASARRVLVEYQKYLLYILVDRWRMRPLPDGPATALIPARSQPE